MDIQLEKEELSESDADHLFRLMEVINAKGDTGEIEDLLHNSEEASEA